MTETKATAKMSLTKTIGFIGAGRMASALAFGVVNSGLIDSGNIIAFDPYPIALIPWQDKKCQIASSNKEVIAKSDIVILAVKPQMVDEICADLEVPLQGKLVVSIMAGITMAKLMGGDQLIPSRHRGGMALIRVMPNTPCLVNKSASVFCASKQVVESDKADMRMILNAVGLCYEVSEDKIDAVTGLSGSGPAYVYMVIEAMTEAGVKLGLPREMAVKLAAQTVSGAAQMVLEEGEDPAVLRGQVCSPGGTTICGVAELERLGLRHALMRAVEASAEKSKELSLPKK